MAARLAIVSVVILVVMASLSIGTDGAATGELEIPAGLLRQLELANLCQSRETRPVPKMNQFKAKTIMGWGHHKFDCILANLSAYLKVDDDKYVPLDLGVVDEAGSVCPHLDEALGMYMGILRIDYFCIKLSFFIARRDPTAPMKITHIHTNLDYPPADNVIPLPSGRTDEVTYVGYKTQDIGHAYQCQSEQIIPLSNKWKHVYSAKLVISNLTIEAFRDVTEPDFHQPKSRCKLDEKLHSSSFGEGHNSMYI